MYEICDSSLIGGSLTSTSEQPGVEALVSWMLENQDLSMVASDSDSLSSLDVLSDYDYEPAEEDERVVALQDQHLFVRIKGESLGGEENEGAHGCYIGIQLLYL